MSEATLNIHDQYLADLAREPVNGQPDWVTLAGAARRTRRLRAPACPPPRLEEWRAHEYRRHLEQSRPFDQPRAA